MLKDRALAERFSRFHRDRACLLVISPIANLSILRRGSR
jgi:hypothetical protein